MTKSSLSIDSRRATWRIADEYGKLPKEIIAIFHLRFSAGGNLVYTIDSGEKIPEFIDVLNPSFHRQQLPQCRPPR